MQSAHAPHSKEDFIQPAESVEQLLDGQQFAVINGRHLLFRSKGGFEVAAIVPGEDYTVDDYMKLPEGAPFQLVAGKLLYMPSPKDLHQLAVLNISVSLAGFVKKHKLGVVRTAPFDVHLDRRNIYQPDVLFISNERRAILRDWVFGAPDLVVEILSPGTASLDRNRKKKQYGKYGVREYWLVSTERKTVEIFVSQDGKLISKSVLPENGRLTSPLFPGFELTVREILEE